VGVPHAGFQSLAMESLCNAAFMLNHIRPVSDEFDSLRIHLLNSGLRLRTSWRVDRGSTQSCAIVRLRSICNHSLGFLLFWDELRASLARDSFEV